MSHYVKLITKVISNTLQHYSTVTATLTQFTKLCIYSEHVSDCNYRLLCNYYKHVIRVANNW